MKKTLRPDVHLFLGDRYWWLARVTIYAAVNGAPSGCSGRRDSICGSAVDRSRPLLQPP